jgi:hypothetical protein
VAELVVVAWLLADTVTVNTLPFLFRSPPDSAHLQQQRKINVSIFIKWVMGIEYVESVNSKSKGFMDHSHGHLLPIGTDAEQIRV